MTPGATAPVSVLLRSPDSNESAWEEWRANLRNGDVPLEAPEFDIYSDEGLIQAVLGSLALLVTSNADRFRGDAKDISSRLLKKIRDRFPGAVAGTLIGAISDRISAIGNPTPHSGLGGVFVAPLHRKVSWQNKS